MDTPVEEQRMFQSVTSYIAASEPEITEPNMLSVDFINHVSCKHRSEKIFSYLNCFWSPSSSQDLKCSLSIFSILFSPTD